MAVKDTQQAASPEALNPVLNPVAPIRQPIGVVTAAAPVALTPSSPTYPPAGSAPNPTSSVTVIVPNTTGTVTFSLVVTDNLGVQSQPARATVTIQGAPVAVLTATPPAVTEGGAIELSGAGSTSSGSISSYTFALVPPNPTTGTTTIT